MVKLVGKIVADGSVKTTRTGRRELVMSAQLGRRRLVTQLRADGSWTVDLETSSEHGDALQELASGVLGGVLEDGANGGEQEHEQSGLHGRDQSVRQQRPGAAE